jgi:hypothetical protein
MRRAIEVLREQARYLRRASTYKGRWFSSPNHIAHDEMLALADELDALAAATPPGRPEYGGTCGDLHKTIRVP